MSYFWRNINWSMCKVPKYVFKISKYLCFKNKHFLIFKFVIDFFVIIVNNICVFTEDNTDLNDNINESVKSVKIASLLFCDIHRSDKLFGESKIICLQNCKTFISFTSSLWPGEFGKVLPFTSCLLTFNKLRYNRSYIVL